ncbi:UNVERIFIED_ORG: hypothetical protein FNL38_102189 [Nocardia globerula]|uniref:Uncharacterized protein n=1 Tax=Nocardia globerula TaxID=1818 RepID=A0A652YSF7_NOCGL
MCTEEASEIESGAEMDQLMKVFAHGLVDAAASPRGRLVRIGASALRAPTVSEVVRRSVIEARLPLHDWPNRLLMITAIDVQFGGARSVRGGSGDFACCCLRGELCRSRGVAVSDDR